MKRIILLAILGQFAASKAQNWTWLRGTSTIATTGAYGTKGTASSLNDPGARHGCATWVDASGNLWLFGGEGFATNNVTCWLNDLWKYDPVTNEWTWMRGSNGPNALGVYGTLGVASSTAEPGAREFMAYWTDQSGRFWMFGGDGFGTAATAVAERLADLWMYDPNSNQWTWMGGSSSYSVNGNYGTKGVQTAGTYPGGRYGSSCWVDNTGKFWLLGGHGYPASGTQTGMLNDLWRYDPVMKLWTWMKGSNLIGQLGTYGTLNVSNAANEPGGRRFGHSWTDPQGTLWFFGGEGLSSTAMGRNNDLWKYDTGTNNWTWAGGSNIHNQPAEYGTIGVPSSTNIPGGRMYGATWVDGMGHLWMFGGYGYVGVPTPSTNPVPIGRLNDMFRYNPSTGEWTWMKGSNVINVAGTYGPPGSTLATNMPGSRFYNNFWKRNNYQLFLFGGEGHDAQNQFGHLNDLWRFAPHCSPDSVTGAPSALICSGQQVTLTAHNQLPSSVMWFNQGVNGSPIGTGSVLTSISLTTSGTPTTVSFFAEANTCTALPRAMYTVSVMPLPTVQVAGTSSVCEGAQFSLTASGAASYTWNTGANSTVIVANGSPPASTFAVTGEQSGCVASASISVDVAPAPAFSVLQDDPEICIGSTVTIAVTGTNNYIWSNSIIGNSISVSPTVTTVYTVTATAPSGCKTSSIITQSVSQCLGIRAYDENNLSLFPIPGRGTFNFGATLSSDASIRIFSLTGALVDEIMLSAGSSCFHTSLPAGAYLYRLVVDEKAVSGRLIIE